MNFSDSIEEFLHSSIKGYNKILLWMVLITGFLPMIFTRNTAGGQQSMVRKYAIPEIWITYLDKIFQEFFMRFQLLCKLNFIQLNIICP